MNNHIEVALHRRKYVRNIKRLAWVLAAAILLQGIWLPNHTAASIVTSNLTITVNGNQISLNWNDLLVNEKGYIVERRIDSGDFHPIAYLGSNATTSWDYLDASRIYTYRVKATNSENITYIYTDEVSLRLNDLVSPNSLDVRAEFVNQIDLKWTYPDQKAYNTVIERRAENDTTWYTVARVGIGENIYSDKSIVPGVKYYYKVRAYLNESIKTTAYPDEYPGKGVHSLLYKPTGLYGYALSRYQIQLRWQAGNSMASAFVIERKSPKDGVYKEVAVVSQNTTAYIDTVPEENVLYSYRIKAVTGTAVSEYSDPANVTSTYIRTPSNLSAVYESSTGIKLSWIDPADAVKTGFEIWRKAGNNTATGAVWELYEEMGRDARTYTDMNVSPQTYYTYKIRGKVNDNSIYSDFSNEITVWTSDINAPANLSSKITGKGEVELAWEHTGKTEAGFLVERKVGAFGQWFVIASLEPNKTTYVDKWANTTDINYYRIKVYDSSNAVNYSNEVIVSLKTPEAPSNLQAHALSSNEVYLTWQDNSIVESEFIIERKQFYIFREIARVGANTVSFTDPAASPDTTSIYRVRAANGSYESDNTNEATATTNKRIGFTDLKSYSWAVAAIENLAGRNVFSLTNNSKFNPQETITKGEFCSILIRSLELKSISAGRFADVTSTHKYYDEIMSAAKLGIIAKDKNNKVYPDAIVTREQAGIMLALALKAKGTPLPEANTSILKEFADYRSISDSSAENIAAVCGAGILNGRMEDGRNYLRLKDYLNRAEAAVMAYKGINYLTF